MIHVGTAVSLRKEPDIRTENVEPDLAGPGPEGGLALVHFDAEDAYGGKGNNVAGLQNS